ncbi:MAG: S8 family serine peptidase [Patescibacteria group bacterium]
MRIKIEQLFFILTAIIIAFPVQAYLPSDPMYGEQSYLKQISVEQAWDVAKGDGVVVAVIDSGVDIDHPDLSFNIWKNINEVLNDGVDNDHNGYIDDLNGWDFVSNIPDPRPKLEEGYAKDAINHGTAIAGLIAAAANNDKGIVGVAFNAKIMPLRILDATGSGDVEDLVKAIDYAVNNGADIINLSLVGYDYSANLADAIRRAYQKAVVVVAAAGNTDSDIKGINVDVTPAYPACYGNNSTDNRIMAVTAVDQNSVKSLFANYGKTCIDIASPGEDITSLSYYYPADNNFKNYYSYNWNGTSFSTALVSGVAALLKSKQKSLTPSQIIYTLDNEADNINSQNPLYVGQLGGRLNAARTLNSDLISLEIGRLVKLANRSAVYFVDSSDNRHLFVNEPTYWSWYSGTWSDQKIETISQNEFDNLLVGKNVTIRPGANLIKFENSPRFYAVTPNAVIRYATNLVAAKLYGSDYQKRVVTIQDGFENDYSRGSDLTDSSYPDGSLIQYADSSDIYYLENGNKRLVEPAAFSANGFKESFIIKNVSQTFFFNTGKTVSELEDNIFIYHL